MFRPNLHRPNLSPTELWPCAGDASIADVDVAFYASHL